MPRVTIWIREEDYDKWQSIDDKPKWLHEHLNTEQHSILIPPNYEIIEPTVTEPEETA